MIGTINAIIMLWNIKIRNEIIGFRDAIKFYSQLFLKLNYYLFND